MPSATEERIEPAALVRLQAALEQRRSLTRLLVGLVSIQLFWIGVWLVGLSQAEAHRPEHATQRAREEGSSHGFSAQASFRADSSSVRVAVPGGSSAGRERTEPSASRAATEALYEGLGLPSLLNPAESAFLSPKELEALKKLGIE